MLQDVVGPWNSQLKLLYLTFFLSDSHFGCTGSLGGWGTGCVGEEVTQETVFRGPLGAERGSGEVMWEGSGVATRGPQQEYPHSLQDRGGDGQGGAVPATGLLGECTCCCVCPVSKCFCGK